MIMNVNLLIQSMYKVIQLCLPEGCRDELGPVRQLVYHVGHGLPVHRVQRLVDLVKQVEGGGVTFLGGEVSTDAVSLVEDGRTTG